MAHNPLFTLAKQPTNAESSLTLERGLSVYYRHDLPGRLEPPDNFSLNLLTFFLTHNERQVTYISGHGEYDGQMRRGDFYLCPHGVTAKTRWESADRTLHLGIESGLMHRVAMEVGYPESVELMPVLKGCDRKISHLSELFLIEVQGNGDEQSLYLESLSTALCTHLLEQYGSRTAKRSQASDGLSPARLKRVLDYIQTHLSDELSLAMLAELIGLSRFYFVHRFKRSMGMTPYQYVSRQRVERAKQLLKMKEMAIAEVALASGFSSQSHLTRMFRKYVGTTPGAYRRQL
ncbi:MAG: AraC family transcriptional regulator [Cyanobacteria bacterium J06632_3]